MRYYAPKWEPRAAGRGGGVAARVAAAVVAGGWAAVVLVLFLRYSGCYSFAMLALFMRYSCVILVLFLRYSCVIPALFLRYSCVIPALFLRYFCVIPASFLRYSCVILALFRCYSGFIPLVIPSAPPPSVGSDLQPPPERKSRQDAPWRDAYAPQGRVSGIKYVSGIVTTTGKHKPAYAVPWQAPAKTKTQRPWPAVGAGCLCAAFFFKERLLQLPLDPSYRATPLQSPGRRFLPGLR